MNCLFKTIIQTFFLGKSFAVFDEDDAFYPWERGHFVRSDEAFTA